MVTCYKSQLIALHNICCSAERAAHLPSAKEAEKQKKKNPNTQLMAESSNSVFWPPTVLESPVCQRSP